MTEKDLAILVDWIVHRLWIWQEDDGDNNGVEILQTLQIVLIPYLNKIEEKVRQYSKEDIDDWNERTIDLIKNDELLTDILKEYDLELIFETKEKGKMS